MEVGTMGYSLKLLSVKDKLALSKLLEFKMEMLDTYNPDNNLTPTILRF